jgi:hypothetical protein
MNRQKLVNLRYSELVEIAKKSGLQNIRYNSNQAIDRNNLINRLCSLKIKEDEKPEKELTVKQLKQELKNRKLPLIHNEVKGDMLKRLEVIDNDKTANKK